MGNLRIDVSNVVTISLVAFVGVFIINRALVASGKPNWQA